MCTFYQKLAYTQFTSIFMVRISNRTNCQFIITMRPRRCQGLALMRLRIRAAQRQRCLRRDKALEERLRLVNFMVIIPCYIRFICFWNNGA
jgi:hypothetical protein